MAFLVVVLRTEPGPGGPVVGEAHAVPREGGRLAGEALCGWPRGAAGSDAAWCALARAVPRCPTCQTRALALPEPG